MQNKLLLRKHKDIQEKLQKTVKFLEIVNKDIIKFENEKIVFGSEKRVDNDENVFNIANSIYNMLSNKLNEYILNNHTEDINIIDNRINLISKFINYATISHFNYLITLFDAKEKTYYDDYYIIDIKYLHENFDSQSTFEDFKNMIITLIKKEINNLKLSLKEKIELLTKDIIANYSDYIDLTKKTIEYYAKNE